MKEEIDSEDVQHHVDSNKVKHPFPTNLNLECVREGSEVRPDSEQTVTEQSGDNSSLVSTHLHITTHCNCQSLPEDTSLHARARAAVSPVLRSLHSP